jgi:hypothetical protein
LLACHASAPALDLVQSLLEGVTKGFGVGAPAGEFVQSRRKGRISRGKFVALGDELSFPRLAGAPERRDF